MFTNTLHRGHPERMSESGGVAGQSRGVKIKTPCIVATMSSNFDGGDKGGRGTRSAEFDGTSFIVDGPI